MVVVWQEWDNSRFVYEHKTRMFLWCFRTIQHTSEFEVLKCAATGASKNFQKQNKIQAKVDDRIP